MLNSLYQKDTDGDGVGDVCDNCSYRNPLQVDADQDGRGDGDKPGDLGCDNCKLKANFDQSDIDKDGIGDVCDNCLTISNPEQTDANKNGVGDLCEGLDQGSGTVAQIGEPKGFYRFVRDKRYELSNHLGNVLAVISDRTLAGTNNTLTPDVLSYSDYYPFGQLVPNRHANSKKYRYGFNGMELDNELKGEGNSYDFGARMLDPRVGRWFAPDPMERKSPDWSPYRFCFDNPLRWIDNSGKYETDGHYWTVYMVGLMVGLDNVSAERLARLAERPDTSIHKNIASEQNYTWADAGMQKSVHSLRGSNAIVSVNIALAIAQFKNAKTDEQLSFSLHYLGDAFAHQRMNGRGYYGDKGKVNTITGKIFEIFSGGTAEHAHGTEADGTKTGLRPDLIYERVPLYMNYVNVLASSIKDKYSAKGQIDADLFKKLTDYASKNKVSLIGIMNYEVAKLKEESTFNIMRSTGLAEDNWSIYIRNTENYLQENKVNYKTEGVYSESLGGTVRTLEGYKFTIIK